MYSLSVPSSFSGSTMTSKVHWLYHACISAHCMRLSRSGLAMPCPSLPPRVGAGSVSYCNSRAPWSKFIDDEVRNLTMKAAESSAIRRIAAAKGMNSLREDGSDKVLAGMTTVEEVLRVTQEDLI